MIALALLLLADPHPTLAELGCLPAAQRAANEATRTATSAGWRPETELEGILWLGAVRYRACAEDLADVVRVRDAEIARRIAAPPPPAPVVTPEPEGWSTLQVALLSAGVALGAAAIGTGVGYLVGSLAP